MTTPPPDPTRVTKRLDNAIDTYSDDANFLYEGLHDQAVPATLPKRPQPDDPSAEDSEEKNAADEAFAKAQIGSAFSQLGNAAKLQAEQADRAGFAAVVKLMKTTADSADKISKKLLELLKADPSGATAPTDYAWINALTSALSVLAELSPSDVWTTQAGSGARG